MTETTGQTTPQAFRAQWVLPVASPPIRDGVVVCRDGLIVDVGPAKRFAGLHPIDLGAVALIPGLVNAHTHLEFSNLTQPLGSPGIRFTDWIGEVVAHRMREASRELTVSKAECYQLGLHESEQSGVVAVGEISSFPYCSTQYFLQRSAQASGKMHDETQILVTAFLEVLGRQPELIDEKLLGMTDEFNCFTKPNGPAGTELNQNQIGMSPHAPYSVHPELLQQLIQHAIDSKLPLAMHLAESEEELQLMHSHEGPFVDLLQKLGAWFPETYQLRSVRSYLECLVKAPHVLLVHGNYFSESDMDLVAQHSDTMHVVFCPRTHEYFGHSPHPFPQLLKRGVNVAVGTDSRASNPDLNLFSELKAIARKYAGVDPLQILSMGTLAGARALCRDDHLGSIETGKSARLCVVKQPHESGGWSLEHLFDGECHLLTDYLAE